MTSLPRTTSSGVVAGVAVENAFNDASFLYYSLEFFPESGTLCLKEVYDGENGSRFGFSYLGYAESAEDARASGKLASL